MHTKKKNDKKNTHPQKKTKGRNEKLNERKIGGTSNKKKKIIWKTHRIPKQIKNEEKIIRIREEEEEKE